MLNKNDIKEAKSIFRELDEIRCAEPAELTLGLLNNAIRRAQEFLQLIECLGSKKLKNKITDILQKFYDRSDIAYDFLLDAAHILNTNHWTVKRRFKSPDNSIKHYTYPFYLAFEIILKPSSYSANRKKDGFIRVTKEFYWSALEVKRAEKFLKAILDEAGESILIQDNYLDETVFNHIGYLGGNIMVSLLLKKVEKKFVNKLCQCHQKCLLVKTNSQCHDRFIVIDNKKVWHLGSSINKLGVKAGMINLVENKKTVRKIIEDFRTWWDEGRAIYTFVAN